MAGDSGGGIGDWGLGGGEAVGGWGLVRYECTPYGGGVGGVVKMNRRFLVCWNDG